MEKTNEILTIAGERVEKRYSTKAGDCCDKCCFWSDTRGMCDAERADSTPPCQDYDSKESGFAYFVRAEEKRRKIRVKNMGKIKAELQKNIDEAKEIEGISQEVTLIPSNEDADRAAEEACAKCTISGRCFVEDKGRKDACDYLRGVKAGIAYEREGLMKEAVQGEVVHINGFPTLENVVLPSEFLRGNMCAIARREPSFVSPHAGDYVFAEFGFYAPEKDFIEGCIARNIEFIEPNGEA